MEKRAIMLLIILMAVGWAAAPCLAQEKMHVVDNAIFPDTRCSPALFDHDGHNEKAGIDDCGVCHHVYQNGRKSEVETSEDSACVECHALKAGADNPIGLRRAFHLRCIGCHQIGEVGPLMCAECHPRASLH
ncbi:MAG: cytochrome c3 family protein [Desulfobacteraceae bacterium]|nr:cytochrome c3 family protein [Desulfobacteraceae bacterium]